ncbi:unnamed protein product [Didymodactylos carnosus]|uniref:Tetratricopeptide repeat protein n=1 Tax=Didymodactylos carnosus TaxID=1234261 RepID=A0A815FCJ7_9BILA|nr:unnamed protein product [Didymodactylos carnosus]CAF1323451.1 unnamed protein product [Didymodactylos carnosus]CAF3920442.1 unnamed protein product [Didymodactylos carnosus]CAF4171339.1 unnamed protein product [Didymodactylos carnosus]
MGEVYLDLSDFDKALDYFHQALNIYKEKFGDNINQRNIAKCYHLIGQVYLKQNDANRALEYFHLTLNMWEITLIDNHPDLALCTENIAHAYLLKSEYRDALKYFSRTLNIYEKRLPLNDAKIIDIQRLLDNTKEKG